MTWTWPASWAQAGEIATGVRVENCANYAEILATDSKGMGGIVGAGWGTGYIVNCYNTGKVVNEKYPCPAGGICGSNDGMDIYACYNVGTIQSQDGRGRGIGGHDSGSQVTNCYNYGKVALGQDMVCDNLGGVIGRDMKKSDAKVQNAYYLDTSCAFAVMNGEDENVTAVSAADFAGESFLRKLNADGCFILRNHQYPELKMAADLVGGDPVLLRYQRKPVRKRRREAAGVGCGHRYRAGLRPRQDRGRQLCDAVERGPADQRGGRGAAAPEKAELTQKSRYKRIKRGASHTGGPL